MTQVIPLAFPAPETLHLHRDRHLAARRPLQSRTVTTFSSLPTRIDHRPLDRKSGSKNILLRSNVTSVQRNLLELTIFDLIFALIQTSDRLSAQSVAKLSLVNMIAKGTRVCTAERRSLFAVVNWARAVIGDAVEDLLVRTLSAGISEAKLEECASSHCWMKKQWSDSEYLTSR